MAEGILHLVIREGRLCCPKFLQIFPRDCTTAQGPCTVSANRLRNHLVQDLQNQNHSTAAYGAPTKVICLLPDSRESSQRVSPVYKDAPDLLQKNAGHPRERHSNG